MTRTIARLATCVTAVAAVFILPTYAAHLLGL